jgi:hypothetical protein
MLYNRKETAMFGESTRIPTPATGTHGGGKTHGTLLHTIETEMSTIALPHTTAPKMHQRKTDSGAVGATAGAAGAIIATGGAGAATAPMEIQDTDQKKIGYKRQ